MSVDRALAAFVRRRLLLALNQRGRPVNGSDWDGGSGTSGTLPYVCEVPAY